MRREKTQKKRCKQTEQKFPFFPKEGSKNLCYQLGTRSQLDKLAQICGSWTVHQSTFLHRCFLLWGTLLGLYSKYPEIAVMNWLLQIARNHWSITGEICSYRHFGLWSPTNNSKNLAQNLEQLSWECVLLVR